MRDPQQQEALWQLVRQVGPPANAADARERLLTAIEARRAPRRRLWLAPVMMAAVLTAVWLGGRGGAGEPEQPGTQVAGGAGEPEQPGTQDADGVGVPAPPVAPVTARASEPTVSTPAPVEPATLESGDRIETARATLEAVAAAQVAVTGDLLEIRAGTVELRGAAEIHGPSCRASVEGHCRVSVAELHTTVTVFAGSVELVDSSASCEIVYELDEVEPVAEPTARTAARAAGGATSEAEPAPVADEPSDLARQLDAYDDAIAQRSGDPEGALVRLRRHRAAWPDSAIAYEVDVAIVELLIETGRTEQGRVAARRFLRRYPDSPKAGAMRELLR